MFEGIKKWLNSTFTKKEVYVRVVPPEQMAKFESDVVNLILAGRIQEAREKLKHVEFQMQGTTWELSEAQKKLMQLNKLVEEKEDYIKSLEGKKDAEQEKEAKRQQEQLDRIKKTKEFDILFSTKITVMSALDNEFFRNREGKEMPYWVGMRFVSTEWGPYLKLLMSSGSGKPQIFQTNPPIFIHKFYEIFHNVRTVVHTLKAKAPVSLNIDAKGNFIGTRIIFKKRSDGKSQEKIN